MSQYTLLLLELILVAAAGYFFWSTRKLLAQHSQRLTGMLQPDQMDAMEMARDVAELLTELQAMAGTVRSDLAMQTVNLQDTLGQAEVTITDLKRLLAKTEAEVEPTEPPKPVHTPLRSQIENRPPSLAPAQAEAKPVAEKKAVTTLTRNFGQAVAEYTQFLRRDNRSEATIARLEGHVRELLTWLAGQRYSEAPLSRIDATEFEAYISYLETQNYRPATLKRKLAALRSFSSWVESALNGEAPPPIATEESPAVINHTSPETVESDSEVASTSQMNQLVGQSRYQAVMAMADEGLEQSAIAARTGLEQEAIRMMLKMAPASSIKH